MLESYIFRQISATFLPTTKPGDLWTVETVVEWTVLQKTVFNHQYTDFSQNVGEVYLAIY